MASEADVVIVGAGLSGLIAARDMLTLGTSRWSWRLTSGSAAVS
jgi:cation diffusion facilitator CzcD-associated flavoprotein CzcO